jgi:hypothetical protein
MAKDLENPEQKTSDLVGLVRKGGDKVSIHTEECVLWGLEHSNCEGCSSELGCAKVTRYMLVGMLPVIYQAKGFEEFLKMQEHISEVQEKILNAKTPEDLKKIPSM